MDFEKWYHSEWIKHIQDSGGIKAQLRLLTWMVGVLLTSNIALVGFLVVTRT
jgi:hypothetical protein